MILLWNKESVAAAVSYPRDIALFTNTEWIISFGMYIMNLLSKENTTPVKIVGAGGVGVLILESLGPHFISCVFKSCKARPYRTSCLEVRGGVKKNPVNPITYCYFQ